MGGVLDNLICENNVECKWIWICPRNCGGVVNCLVNNPGNSRKNFMLCNVNVADVSTYKYATLFWIEVFHTKSVVANRRI